MNRTWSRWQFEGRGQGPISLPHYEAIGTKTHALDLHAEKAYADLADVRQQRICEKIFKALTDATDGRGIRRPTSLVTLCDLADTSQTELIEVIDVFRKPSRSFVMPPLSEGLEPDTVMDISHESLMRVWGRLKVWAAEEAQSAHRYRRLWETANEHAANKADLLRDPELQLSLDWRQGTQPNAAWASLYGGDFDSVMRFLTDSKREADNARKRACIKRVSGWIGAVLALVVIVMVGLFVYNGWRKEWGDWTTKPYKVDFTQPWPDGPPLARREEWLKDNFDFQNPEGTSETSPWPIEKNAMVMKPHEWCWLKKVQIASDTKVVIHLRFTDSPEAFQICINAKKKSRQRDNNPPGYSCRFGIWGGAMDLITGNGLDRENDFNSLLSSPTKGGGGGDFCLTFTRQGENVTLEVKGKDIRGKDIQYAHHETFLVPLLGGHDASGERTGQFENIGIRTGGKEDSVRVLSVSASRFKLPEMASPTVAGDALVESGDPKAAIEKYKTIAEDYQPVSNPVAALALTKGYLLAAQLTDSKVADEQPNYFLGELRKPVALKWWQSIFQGDARRNYLGSIWEIEALMLWKEEKYGEALDLFRKIFKANPDTRIVKECLRAEHRKLEDKVAGKFLSWIATTFAHTPKLAGLDINSFQITNLDPLNSIRSLRGLDCSRNQLTSLDSLKNMVQLRALYCGQNRISTLEPLNALSLIELYCNDNRIDTLEPLRPMHLLERLYCGSNQIESLSPLKGKPLYALDCSLNKITSLDPIPDLHALEELYCASNQIRSLEPLRNSKNLHYLDCRSNAIESLEPLKDLELYSLDCSGNRILTLDPYIDSKNPPAEFIFDCDTLPDTQLERAQSAWSAKGRNFDAGYCELLLALRHNDLQKAKMLASDYGGHRYLFVRNRLSAADTKQFCARLGGHLVAITSESENAFLRQVVPTGTSCRIGLVVVNGKPQWVTGESAEKNFVPTLTDFRPTDGIVTWKNGSWLPLPLKDDKPMPFIIGWDEAVTE